MRNQRPTCFSGHLIWNLAAQHSYEVTGPWGEITTAEAICYFLGWGIHPAVDHNRPGEVIKGWTAKTGAGRITVRGNQMFNFEGEQIGFATYVWDRCSECKPYVWGQEIKENTCVRHYERRRKHWVSHTQGQARLQANRKLHDHGLCDRRCCFCEHEGATRIIRSVEDILNTSFCSYSNMRICWFNYVCEP